MNSWFWTSEEEFQTYVRTNEIAARNAACASGFYAASRNVEWLFQEIHRFIQAHEKFKHAFGLAIDGRYTDQNFDELMGAAMRLVHSAEIIFAYCRPIAFTKEGEEFIWRKEIYEHLPRYHKEGTRRYDGDAKQILDAADALLGAIDVFFEGDNSFLVHVVNLPDELKIDFVSARDLMSLGFDEAGLIYAGRGLEGVVRRIAKDHKVGRQPVERQRFFDILKALESKKFIHDQSLVIDESTKHLLVYSRTTRNQTAHPAQKRNPQPYREQVMLMAQKASELWKSCSMPGSKLV